MIKKYLWILLVFFYISCSGGGKTFLTWYVKPFDPTRTSGNGLSYCEAWNGIKNINWQEVQPGDTIYLCGTFSQTINIKGKGDIAYPIKIKGNCPKEDCGKGERGIDRAVIIPSSFIIENWNQELKGYKYLEPPPDSGILYYMGDELKGGVETLIAKDNSAVDNGYEGYIKLQALSLTPYACGNVCPDENDTDYMNHLNTIFTNLGENQYYYEACCNILYWKPSPSVEKKIYVAGGVGINLPDSTGISISGVIFIGGDTGINIGGNKAEYIEISDNKFRWIKGTGIKASVNTSEIDIFRNHFAEVGTAISLKGDTCKNLSRIDINNNNIHSSLTLSLEVKGNIENLSFEENVVSDKGIRIETCDTAKNININFNHLYNIKGEPSLYIDTSNAVNPDMLNIQFNLFRDIKDALVLLTYDTEHPYIYNNTFYKIDTVLRWKSSPTPRQPALFFVNNILYEISSYYVCLENTDDYMGSPLLINNNMYYTQSSALDPGYCVGGNVYTSYRRWRDNIRFFTQNNANESSSIEGEPPGFVNESGIFSEVKDFKLRCDAFAVDKGAEPFGIKDRDFFGNPVPKRAPDIGFHEFQGEPCPS